MWKSEGREEEMSDVVQMRLVLADFQEEMAGLGFGPCSSPQSQLLGLFTETRFSHSKGYLTGWKEEIFILRVFVPYSLGGLGLLDVSPNAQNVALYHIQRRPNEKDKSFHVLDRGA